MWLACLYTERSKIMAKIPCEFDIKGMETTNIDTTSVPSAVVTNLAHVTLKAGHTYLVVGGNSWTESVPNVLTICSFSEGSATTRNTDGMYGGGGVQVCQLFAFPSDTVLYLRAYQSSGATRTASYVFLQAYRLD